jgi:hypothetical protein
MHTSNVIDMHTKTVRGASANTSNMNLTAIAVERLMGRAQGLPGIGCLYGPAGWGKTYAALEAANVYRAFYVQATAFWTKKWMLQDLCRAVGIPAAGTVRDMVMDLSQNLLRPVIIDEFDYCIQKGLVEVVRSLYEMSQGAFLIIGEEGVANALRRSERFHSRILSWIPAAPVNLNDARALRPIYAPDVEVADDLLEHLVTLAHGSVRRVVVNLDTIHEEALVQGWQRVDRALWGNRPLYTGDAPKRRV